jgi:hypothetical protein
MLENLLVQVFCTTPCNSRQNDHSCDRMGKVLPGLLTQGGGEGRILQILLQTPCVLDKNRTMGNVQKHNICTNVPSSQAFRAYFAWTVRICTEQFNGRLKAVERDRGFK